MAEERLSAFLWEWTSVRNKCLDSLHIDLKVSGGLTHLVGVCCALVVSVAVFNQLRSLTLFSMHPLCMTIGIGMFMSEGIIAFRNRYLLDALAPIMESSKKTKARNLHRTIQYIATFFIVSGLLAIMGHKANIFKSLIPCTIHSILGTLALLCIAVQVFVGNEKMASTTKIRRWHGNFGLMTWDLLILSMLLGFIQFFKSYVSLFLCFCTMVFVWSNVHGQFRGSSPSHGDSSIDDAEEMSNRAGRNTGHEDV